MIGTLYDTFFCKSNSAKILSNPLLGLFINLVCKYAENTIQHSRVNFRFQSSLNLDVLAIVIQLRSSSLAAMTCKIDILDYVIQYATKRT